MKVLLGDTDTDLLDLVAYALQREGFTVITASDGMQALRRWQADRPDVIVLEVDLPGLSGLDICRRIRERESTPVILLSAQTADEQVVRGFQVGADDYVGKPFSLRELVLRIRAVGRRAAESGARPSPQGVQVESLSLVLDLETHEVRRGNRQIHLTPLEFRLLHQLASNVGRVVPTERLIVSAWGYGGGDAQVLKSHIAHIRKKLQLPRQGPGSLSSVPRVGYRLER